MKLGTTIKLPDGRVGTICWNHLNGTGGVWGKHDFSEVTENFSDDLPAPQFMLRNKSVEKYMDKGVECVGEEYEVMPL